MFNVLFYHLLKSGIVDCSGGETEYTVALPLPGLLSLISLRVKVHPFDTVVVGIGNPETVVIPCNAERVLQKRVF